jgi:DNA-binding transcriptional regulator LsrR (DeoR family)
LLQSEGQTLADIGRTYGISRQLVSRLVNEPDPSPLA